MLNFFVPQKKKHEKKTVKNRKQNFMLLKDQTFRIIRSS